MEALGTRTFGVGPAIALVVALSAIGAMADVLLKTASGHGQPFRNVYFGLGCLTYASTAFLWVVAMRSLKLGALGAVYSVATVVLLTLAGMWGFGETLRPREWAGLALAIGSVILLSGKE